MLVPVVVSLRSLRRVAEKIRVRKQAQADDARRIAVDISIRAVIWQLRKRLLVELGIVRSERLAGVLRIARRRPASPALFLRH